MPISRSDPGYAPVPRPITGDVFKCQLKPVEEALNDGTYGNRSFTAEQVARLKEIHPQGVCDYDKPDAGKPNS